MIAQIERKTTIKKCQKIEEKKILVIIKKWEKNEKRKKSKKQQKHQECLYRR